MVSPVHRTIFLIDVEKYGAAERTTPDLLALRSGLYGALERAFLDCGLPWQESRLEDAGDGLFVLVPATVPKSAFVERFPTALAEAVRAHNARHPKQAQFRVRVALHAGEIAYDEHGVASRAIIKAYRLLDAKVLKKALAKSDGVLALVMSKWFFEEVVKQSAHAKADTYRRVKVKVKETHETAWIARPDDPYPPQARRTWLRWLGAVVVTALVAVGVVVLWPAEDTFLGDPRTADPCALTYAEALNAYGLVETSEDYGNFNRCDALVYLTQDRKQFVDVRVEFAKGVSDPSLPVHREGTLGIQRPTARPDNCVRLVLLPDDEQVVFQARETGERPVDLCGMTETVLASALLKLQRGDIARRELPAGSLAGKDACALMDATAVTAAVGAGPLERTPDFANWGCDWDYTDRPGVVKVLFDRSEAEDLDGTPVALPGFAARVRAAKRSDTSCTVSIVYRQYTDPNHVLTDELVLVDVEKSDEPPDRLCAPARQLADTVARRLRA